MTDESNRDPVLLKKFFLERENAEQAVDDSPHSFDPPAPPCPNLWSNQVDDRNSPAFHTGGYTEMEIGCVSQNCELRPAFFAGIQKLAVAPPDPRQVSHNFDEANYGQVFGSDHRLNPARAQVWTGTTEIAARWPLAVKVVQEFSGVVISRSLSGRYEDTLRGLCNLQSSGRGGGQPVWWY